MPPFLSALLLDRRAWGALGLAVLLGLLGLQSACLNHAKADLTAARSALIDPATRRDWRTEAVQASANLAICHANVGRLGAALTDQSAAVTALQTAGDAATSAARQAVLAARAGAQDADARAATLLSAKPAAAGCPGADALILGSLNP